MLTTTIRKSGNSNIITIPPAVLALIGAKEGDELQINLIEANSTLRLRKVNKDDL